MTQETLYVLCNAHAIVVAILVVCAIVSAEGVEVNEIIDISIATISLFAKSENLVGVHLWRFGGQRHHKFGVVYHGPGMFLTEGLKVVVEVHAYAMASHGFKVEAECSGKLVVVGKQCPGIVMLEMGEMRSAGSQQESVETLRGVVAVHVVVVCAQTGR